MAGTEALVNPVMLRWARETAGYTVSAAAARLRGIGDPETKLAAWERREGRPSVSQARKLATLYRRPLAVFFLSEAPVEAALPPDYRRGAGRDAVDLSPAVRWRVRHLRDLRQAALDLAEGDPDAFPPFPVRAALTDDLDPVAGRLRQLLGVSVEKQLGWRSGEKAWSHWRVAIEAHACLVFVLDRLPPAELDGFSLAFDRAPVIAVNGSAQITRGRRVFTLMHELAHVALRSEGLCNLEDRAARVEAFCNRVAAALLMPADPFREAATPLAAGGRWPNARLEELAARFSVSRHAVFVRLVAIGLAKQSQYDAWRAAQAAEFHAAPPRREAGPEREGGPSFYQLYLHRMSFPYLRQVFESYHAEQISLTELSDHLGVKPSTALALESRFLERLRARAS